jgi:predicted ribosome quality control (RQC) complex YloA/Tae2 family protein
VEPRKPYYAYESFDGITIRVGRGASDNDELSCNPEHRDEDDYWLHVSGYPGSHVVIRYTGNDFFTDKFRETLLDACVLTAINSKAPQSGKVPVTITRPRFVSKPGGAKPGLVMLRGDVRVVNIDVKAEVAKRMDRLAQNTNKPKGDGANK